MKAYADDTQLLVKAKTVEELKAKIESTIKEAQEWYLSNSLKINPTKTEENEAVKKKSTSRFKKEITSLSSKLLTK